MATAAVGDIYLVSFNLLFGGQRMLNTFRYRLETLGTAVTTDDIYNNMATLLASGGNMSQKYLAAVPSQVQLVSRDYQRVWPTRVRKKIDSALVNGTWVNAGSATNSAVSIERYAEEATRHGIGRVQLPASNSAIDVTGGVITNAGYTTVLQTFATQMNVALTLPVVGSTMKPILQSRAAPASFVYEIGTSVQPTLRSMRRRTVGVGK